MPYQDNLQNTRFHEANTNSKKVRKQKQASKMARIVISYTGGFIKNERQANLFLATLATIALIFSLILIFSNTGSDVTSPDEDLIETPQPAEGYVPR